MAFSCGIQKRLNSIIIVNILFPQIIQISRLIPDPCIGSPWTAAHYVEEFGSSDCVSDDVSGWSEPHR